MPLNRQFRMAADPVESAEMAHMQRLARLCLPLHKWQCRFGGITGSGRATGCINPIAKGAFGDARIAASRTNILIENLFEKAKHEFFVGG